MARIEAIRLQDVPVACRNTDELSWSSWYSSPSEEVRNLQCQNYWTAKFTTNVAPNPFIELVSYVSLIVVQPARVLFLSLATYYIGLVAQFGSGAVYTTVVPLVAAAVYYFTCVPVRQQTNKQLDIHTHDMELGIPLALRNQLLLLNTLSSSPPSTSSGFFDVHSYESLFGLPHRQLSASVGHHQQRKRLSGSGFEVFYPESSNSASQFVKNQGVKRSFLSLRTPILANLVNRRRRRRDVRQLSVSDEDDGQRV